MTCLVNYYHSYIKFNNQFWRQGKGGGVILNVMLLMEKHTEIITTKSLVKLQTRQLIFGLGQKTGFLSLAAQF